MKRLYRKDKIIELCKNKSVLHLGFIQHANLYKKLIVKGDWLHGMIAPVANHLIGIDYLEKEVQEIHATLNYECYCADVTKVDSLPELQEKFDVIVCGELIEHLVNPGLMLDFCRRFMHKNTKLIITTPNPWSKARVRLINKGILEKDWLNSEHTCWFTYQTLTQLLEGKGFIEDNYAYYLGESALKPKYQSSVLNFIRWVLFELRLKFTHEHMQDGLFFVAYAKKNIP